MITVKMQDMKKSLNDMHELLFDVENGLHIPKKFRKAQFTAQLRNKYVAYLKKEVTGLERRVSSLEKPVTVRPVMLVKPKAEVVS
jgi:cob(I)alamin adenosyltransferase